MVDYTSKVTVGCFPAVEMPNNYICLLLSAIAPNIILVRVGNDYPGHDDHPRLAVV